MILKLIRKYPSELLMLALIAQILVSPLADTNPHIGGILAVISLIFLLFGATYIGNKRVIRFVALPLTAVWISARALEAIEDTHPIFAHISPITGLALSCSVLWVIIDRFNAGSQIATNVISEAFIGYMMIAIAFSQLYLILDPILDNPFNIVIPTARTSTFLYFSMTTLSSVAYGGIVPVNSYLRLIAAFESMIGIFYIAVVVARLVSSRRPAAQRNGA